MKGIQWIRDNDFSKIQEADFTCIMAVVETASLFETPAPELTFSVHDAGDHFKVTVMGYKKLVDDGRWVRMFMGSGRSDKLSYVSGLFTHPSNDGVIIKTIHVQKN